MKMPRSASGDNRTGTSDDSQVGVTIRWLPNQLAEWSRLPEPEVVPFARPLTRAEGVAPPTGASRDGYDYCGHSRAIVGEAVTNSGNDAGQMTPMFEDVERRTGRTPKQWLADGGFTDLADIEKAGLFAPQTVEPA